MLRNLAVVVILALLLGFASAQDSSPSSSDSKSANASNQQPSTTTAQPDEQNSPQPVPAKKRSSKTKQKLGDLVPNCTNLIFFHGCRAANPQDEEKQQQRLQDATQRCKQLTAALPASLAHHSAPASTSVPDGQSSSRAGEEALPYCTPEDVLAADHDVDVADFYISQRNYRGAEMRYRSALERLPGEPIASLHLARVLEKLGNKSEAAEQYKVFLLWSPTGKEADEAKSSLDKLQGEGPQK